MSRRAPSDGAPIVMADVMRELQAIADAAERLDAMSILESRRRAQSLLDRLRAQFVFEVAGPGSPSPVAVVDTPGGDGAADPVTAGAADAA